MISRRLVPCLLVSMVAMLFSACSATHTLVAERYPVDQKMLPEFSSNSMISLNNNQQDQSQNLFGTNMGHKFQGDLNQFTNIAIETLEGELKNKNIPVGEMADKKLKLAVTKVHFESRWSGFWCESYIQVETGDGYKTEVDGHDSNAWILFPCIYGALNHSVIAVLNDEKVIEYIEQ